MKEYSFLQEFVFTAAAIPAILGATGLTLGSFGLAKNVRQNTFNNKYMKLMFKELAACNPNNRPKALEIVNRYTSQLTQMYGKMTDKKLAQRVTIMQNFLNTNFRVPLTKIIRNPQDVNWKSNALTYLKKNMSKINNSNLMRTALSATSLAAGGALMSGATNATLGIVSTSAFVLNAAVRQLKTFNSSIYLTRMRKEIQNCPDENRQMAQQILERYCYDIANNIQSIVNKSKKKINFNVQQQLRNRFLIPCTRIINNTNNRYWKITLIDYIDSEKIQGIVQSVCDAISQLLIPPMLRSFQK